MLDFRKDELPRATNGNGTVKFGAFEADLHSGEVRKSGSRVKLQEQPFKVLQILLERPGVLVTREELRARIWPDESFGDFDHAVNVAVGKLRTALGDSADNPSFIETIPRRGYRFVALPEVSQHASTVETSSAQSPAINTPISASRGGRRRVLRITLAVVAAAALLAVGVLLGRRTAKPFAPAFQQLSVMRGTVYTARFAPDGHNVYYSAAWNGRPVAIYATDANFSGTRNLGLPGTALLAVSSSGKMAVVESAKPQSC